MTKLGLKMAVSKTANTLEEAQDIAKNLIKRFPIIIRPAFTLGGTGGGIAYNQEELVEIVTAGIDASMTNQVGPLSTDFNAPVCTWHSVSPDSTKAVCTDDCCSMSSPPLTPRTANTCAPV